MTTEWMVIFSFLTPKDCAKLFSGLVLFSPVIPWELVETTRLDPDRSLSLLCNWVPEIKHPGKSPGFTAVSPTSCLLSSCLSKVQSTHDGADPMVIWSFWNLQGIRIWKPGRNPSFGCLNSQVGTVDSCEAWLAHRCSQYEDLSILLILEQPETRTLLKERCNTWGARFSYPKNVPWSVDQSNCGFDGHEMGRIFLHRKGTACQYDHNPARWVAACR